MLSSDWYPYLRRFSERLALRYEQKKRRAMMRALTAAAPERLVKYGEEAALRSFHRAAASVPWYQKFLRAEGINPGSIRSISDFSRLPVLDKKVFMEIEVADISVGGVFPDAKSILTSSGFSGAFSFGINSADNLENTARMTDAVLDYELCVGSRKTLLINCLAMGVRLRSNVMTVAEVSVREDMALAIIEKFGRYFEQIILVGDAFFIKLLIEEGIKAGLDWRSTPASVIVGGDGFPESYRTYVGNLLYKDFTGEFPKNRIIGSSFGIAEIDLNLFHETRESIRLRRFAEENAEFRKAVFGVETESSPMLFHYYPHRTFLETADGDLIITAAANASIPLVRYRTGDRGRVISYRELQKTLSAFNRDDLLPSLKLPLVTVESRSGRDLERRLVEKVRQRIFADPEIARRVTGYFRVFPEGAKFAVSVQLKKDHSTERDKHEVADRLSLGDVIVHTLEYYQCHEALAVNYEKKFRHL